MDNHRHTAGINNDSDMRIYPATVGKEHGMTGNTATAPKHHIARRQPTGSRQDALAAVVPATAQQAHGANQTRTTQEQQKESPHQK